MKNIEKILTPFNLTFGDKQDLLTILQTIEGSGFAMVEIIVYLEDLKQNRIEATRQAEKDKIAYEATLLKCPECQTLMTLRPINIDPSTQTGDNSKTVWLCPNLKCMRTEYSEKTLEQWQDELKRRI